VKKLKHESVYKQQECPNCRAGDWCALFNPKFAKKERIRSDRLQKRDDASRKPKT
jgi:hypothetical protein